MNEFQTTYCPVCGDLDLTGVDDRNVMISSLCEETGEMRGNLPIVVETAAVRLTGTLGHICDSLPETVLGTSCRVLAVLL